ncbi:hypothetical protein ACFLZB_02940 [Nanoarchaeota archaeon]
MTDTVGEFIEQMHKKSIDDYLNSRGYLRRIADWVENTWPVRIFYERRYYCCVDLSEDLFERLKKERGIPEAGSVIDVGSIVVRKNKADLRITTPFFKYNYNSQYHGLKEIVNQ